MKSYTTTIALLAGLLIAACAADSPNGEIAADSIQSASTPNGSAATPSAPVAVGDPNRAPNEMGRIMVLEYHLVGDKEARWERERGQFRRDLDSLYARGYRPVNMSEVLDKKIDLPAGLSPVVFTFDDASPSQFRYSERNGTLEIDPGTALGVWLDFAKSKPDWRNKAVWCVMSGAEAGRSFFGDKGIEGQKSEWRHQKVKYLADQGFELCNHTLWHAQLSKYPDAFVQQQIAQLDMAVDSAVPGYKIRTMALPQGLWPKNKALAAKGSWTDPKSKRTINYDYEVVFEVAGGPMRSPYDPEFNGHSTPRVQVYLNELKKTMDALDTKGTRYVSDGNPAIVAKAPAK